MYLVYYNDELLGYKANEGEVKQYLKSKYIDGYNPLDFEIYQVDPVEALDHSVNYYTLFIEMCIDDNSLHITKIEQSSSSDKKMMESNSLYDRVARAYFMETSIQSGIRIIIQSDIDDTKHTLINVAKTYLSIMNNIVRKNSFDIDSYEKNKQKICNEFNTYYNVDTVVDCKKYSTLNI